MSVLQVRNSKSVIFFAVAVALVASLLTQLHASAANTVPGSNVLASVNNTNGQGANSSSSVAGISSNGNYVLFLSTATNLVSGASGLQGVYVRNVQTGTTTRVDVSSAGVVDNDQAHSAVMSETGRYIVFETDGTNLIAGKTEPVGQTYLHDMQTGATSMISVNSTGSTIGNATTSSTDYDRPTGVSDDGKYVTIESETLAGGYTGAFDVAYGNTATHAWTRINTNYLSSGLDAIQSSMSCDGSFVAFEENLTASSNKVYLADMRDSSSPQISTISGNYSDSPSISCNGDYVTYATQNRTDVTPTPSGMDSYAHLVEYNRITGVYGYVEAYSTGHFTINESGMVYLPYLFSASIDDAGDVVLAYNGSSYLGHMADGSGTLEKIAKTPGGTYISGYSGYLSADGRHSAFAADAYTLGLTSSDSGYLDAIQGATGL